MFKTVSPLFFLILLSSIVNGKAKYSSYKQIYTANTSNQSFEKRIIAKGKFSSNTYSTNIYFGELENIEEINAFYSTNNKRKKVNKNNIYKSDVITNNFYSGYKSYTINFEKQIKYGDEEFEFNALMSNKELLCISTMAFYQSEDNKIDTFENTVNVPIGHRLIICFNDTTEIPNLQIDSTVNSTIKTYIFRKIFNTGKNSKNKEWEYYAIRVLVCPDNTNPLSYFNQWYQRLLSSIQTSENYKQVCDSLAKKHQNRDSLIKHVFEYTTKKIRYIDIENGVNAFRPRPTDEVLLKQQGDCKDMAFMLKNMYTYLNFEAYIALSSTLSNEYNFDFPTIASADHAICILNYNNKTYYLDATERLGKYDQPSQQIQETNAMLSKTDHAEIINVPKQNTSFNESTSIYTFNINNDAIKGQSVNTYNGYSKLFIDNIIHTYSPTKSKQLLKKFYQDRNYNLNVNNIDYKIINESIQTNADLVLNGNILMKVDNKTFFNFNFCPFPHQFDREVDTLENYIFYKTAKNRTTIEIVFPNKINKVESLYSNVIFDEDGMKYLFKIKHNQNKLIVEYSYENEHVKIPENLTKKYNQLNLLISKTLNHEIIIY